MKMVLAALDRRENGKGFAREVLADAELVKAGKTFNAVNATLAAAAGKNLVTKAKGVLGDKMLTCYTITEAGRAVVNVVEEVKAEAE